VKLEVTVISDSDPVQHRWTNSEHAQYVQGCLIDRGVFGVLVDGKSRIIGDSIP